MFWQNIKFGLRNLIKDKSTSAINILGFSISIAVSILIFLYVFHQFSFDKHISNYQNKYRLISHVQLHGEDRTGTSSNGQLRIDAPAVLPEIKRMISMYISFPFVTCNNKSFIEENADVYFANQDIIPFFSMQFKFGNPDIALKEPYSVIISEKIAQKYFGNKSAIGQKIIWNDANHLTVTGVFYDLPQSTHIPINMVASLETILDAYRISDYMPLRNSFINYIELNDKSDIQKIEKEISAISLSYIPQNLKDMGLGSENKLEELSRIHLYANYDDRYGLGNVKNLYIYSSIAIFLILLSSINYMNLSTAKYSSRTKEIALRKTVGAGKKHLIKQFLTESILVTFFSLCTAIVICEFALPSYNKLLGIQLSIDYFGNNLLLPVIIGIGILLGIISGSYPSFYLSSFNVIEIFSKNIRTGKSNINIRRILVCFQFIITLLLIIITLSINKQLNFISNKNLGFNKENVLIVRLNSKESLNKSEILKNKLQKIPQVISTTISSEYPGSRYGFYTVYDFEDFENKELPTIGLIDIDFNYMESMGLKLVKGRNFSPDFSTDSTEAVLVNETLVKAVGWENAIGKTLWEADDKSRVLKVIGVVKDYHNKSLYQAIKPIILKYLNQKRFLLIRYEAKKEKELLSKVQNIWDDNISNRPLQYWFLDKEFEQLYQSEHNISKLFVYFSGLAILIACLGLFGLITFINQKKVKEVAIRKTLGAPISAISSMIIKEFVILQLIALVLCIPVGYFIMLKWLDHFAYHTEISWWIFIIAGILAFTISILTIGYQTIKAARANPADKLRYQ